MLPARFVAFAWITLLGMPFAGLAQDKKKEIDLTDKFAASDPDFKVQGEYETKGYGAQVVARGDGKFDVYLLGGGLPGAGWDMKTRVKIPATTKEGVVVFADKTWTGNIRDGQLTAQGETKVVLNRIERSSPTLGAKAPPEATILFDGKNADLWNNGKIVDGNLLFCGTSSKKLFGVGKLHIEFRTPYQPKAGGQGRGNSGVYIMGKEIQVLDSFGLNGEKNECGAFYGNAKPRVNMCLPPLTWQTYDVEIHPSAEGDLVATVLHNGVPIHENFVIAKKGAKAASINLQNHGNAVVYRNIWMVEGPSK
jgi:hypothetical protein